RCAGDGQQGSLPHARRQCGERQCSAALLRAALHDSAPGGDSFCCNTLLAYPQGWRPLRPPQRAKNGGGCTGARRCEGGPILMSDPKDFVAGMGSNARKSPTRVVFVTRRTSAQVKVRDEDQVQTYPEVLFRAIVAIEVLTIALVGVSLLFNAPLEGLADPSHTPNPAKAPWYFLGLQEM